nr:hypothetical protein Iba_chr08cCG14730 [Ipomoea batatas]
MSPGLMPVPLIIFSHAGTMKFTSTPAGFIWPMAFAAPKTTAAPAISFFMSSIKEFAPILRLYPPLSKVIPFPSKASLVLTDPLVGL